MTGSDDENRETDSSDESEDSGSPFSKYPPELLGDRERGLSKADREYLAKDGETIDNKQVEINTRSRIRKRIRESIVDFWLISSYLSERDRNLVFREDNEQMSNWQLQIGLKSAIQFFYTGLNHSNLTDFDTVLTSAIHDAECREHDDPVLVDVAFDVEVDEQFEVQKAYDKFQRGVPLDPTEIGVLLITGQVHEEKEIERLARNARSNGSLGSSIAPLLADQLAEVRGEDTPVQAFRSTLAHLTGTEFADGPDESMRSLSNFQCLKEERRLAEEILDETTNIDDLINTGLAKETQGEEKDQHLEDPDDHDVDGEDGGGAEDSREISANDDDEEPAADR